MTSNRASLRISAALAAMAFAAVLGAAAAAGPSMPSPGLPPTVSARSVALVDEATGTLIFGKNPDLVIPPASLTKLVTLHIVYEELDAGRMSRDEIISIDKRDCSPYIPYGSSLMYLHPDMKVAVLDLMRGAAVVSGNDAAFALARRVSGSNDAFASRMNAEISALGFRKMHFVEPSGLSEMNYVTAREFAEFCRRYITLHPESLAELHSLRYIEFPRPEHATADYVPKGRIVQFNRNDMIKFYPGCDGLKTGYIIESGYNLAATAERDGTRFVLVTLGGTGEGGVQGGVDQRSRDGGKIMDWAFGSFVTMKPDLGPFQPPRAWYGASRRVEVEPSSALAVTLLRSQAPSLSWRVELAKSVDAPVVKGARLGEVIFSSEGSVLRRVDLVAAGDVPRGGIFAVIGDAFAKFFSKLFGAA
jgi:serine-type D-Ala-D-Ala carboxypeptidase (penicillin-binding protein 5/6)